MDTLAHSFPDSCPDGGIWPEEVSVDRTGFASPIHNSPHWYNRCAPREDFSYGGVLGWALEFHNFTLFIFLEQVYIFTDSILSIEVILCIGLWEEHSEPTRHIAFMDLLSGETNWITTQKTAKLYLWWLFIRSSRETSTCGQWRFHKNFSYPVC